jgi:hypothetical protein
MRRSNAIDSFCSVISMAGDEPLAGTAMSAAQYVFISWPKSFWARKQFESQGFPSSLSNFLRTLEREKSVSTRLAHQHGIDSRERSQIFIMPDGIKYCDVPSDNIENVLRDYFDGTADREHQRVATKGMYIFCCTHGKRDNCCAKFGQAVVHELRREAIKRRLDLEVWECTHLGSDRFSASAVAFPYGYMYGRMRVENVSDILDYLEKRYPYPPCYRGRLGLDSIEQIAQAFGHSYWFERQIENSEVVVNYASETAPNAAEASVTIVDGDSKVINASFVLKLKKLEFQTYKDCGGVNGGEMKSISRWVVSDSRLIR